MKQIETVTSPRLSRFNEKDDYGLPASYHNVVPRLIDILPSSVEELRLWFTGNPTTQCERLFEGPVSQDNGGVPFLRQPELRTVILRCEESEFPESLREQLHCTDVQVCFREMPLQWRWGWV